MLYLYKYEKDLKLPFPLVSLSDDENISRNLFRDGQTQTPKYLKQTRVVMTGMYTDANM